MRIKNKDSICIGYSSLFAAYFLIALFLIFNPAKAQTCLNADQRMMRAEDVSEPNTKINILNSLIKDCPNRADAHNNLGLLYEEQGNFDLAEKHYRAAAELEPDYPHPFAGLGDVYYSQKNYSQACQYYRIFSDLAEKPTNKVRFPELSQCLSEYLEKLKQCEQYANQYQVAFVPSEEIIEKLTEPRILTRGINRGVGGIREKPGRVVFHILFEFNSDKISRDSARQLEAIAQALKSQKLYQVKIQIEGHTDSIGRPEYNMELSRRRALSVKHYLASRHKVDPAYLEAKWYGEQDPVESNETEAGRRSNRRVELVNPALSFN